MHVDVQMKETVLLIGFEENSSELTKHILQKFVQQF
jgi:hypothetical protein